MSETNKNNTIESNKDLNDDRIYFKDDTNVIVSGNETDKEVDIVNRQVIDAPDAEKYTRDSNDQPVLVFGRVKE